jgi:hypothetical protein
VVECLPSKHEAPSLNPSTAKKINKIKIPSNIISLDILELGKNTLKEEIFKVFI